MGPPRGTTGAPLPRLARAAAGAEAGEPTPETTRAEFARSLLRDGLVPAMRKDPHVLRAFLRMFNLLEPPDSLMSDPEVVGRVMDVYQRRGSRPPEPPLGPDRAEMVGILAAVAGS